jgi:hypothetical protein
MKTRRARHAMAGVGLSTPGVGRWTATRPDGCRTKAMNFKKCFNFNELSFWHADCRIPLTARQGKEKS